MSTNNIDILKKAQAGKQKAQMEVYDTFYKPVFNSCYRILSNKEDAEDMTQDVFIQAFDKKTLIPENTNSEAWLRRVGINKSIDYLRRQQKIEITDNSEAEILEDENTDDIYSQFDSRKLYNCINQLPQQFQLVLNLYLIEGYDHSEISEILNISSSTSRSQLSRAKQKLKTSLLLSRGVKAI